MNSQPDAQDRENRIADYLGIVAGSMRAIPEETKGNFLREMKTHIETLVDQYRDEGRGEPAAVTDALRMIGDPATVGRTWAANWLRANEPGNFLSALALSAVVLVMLQLMYSFVLYLIWPVAQGPNVMNVSFSAPIVVGAVCGWYRPKRATAALSVASVLTSIWFVANFYLQAGKQLTAEAGLAPGTILFFLAAMTIVFAAYTAALMLLGSAVARRWRIRRLTRA
ncbi:MAG: hypothetical protein ABIY70_15675 [Capsulimonas sp.]|uniref:hypothetical protein n=1 Tax=Capsulimonas sp. TaxID=2494211 RepID=UPI003267D2E1